MSFGRRPGTAIGFPFPVVEAAENGSFRVRPVPVAADHAVVVF